MNAKAILLIVVGLALACAPTVIQQIATPPDYHLTVRVVDEQRQPIRYAWLWRTDTGRKIHVEGEDAHFSWQSVGVNFLVCAQAPGHVAACRAISERRDQVIVLALAEAR